MSALLQQQLELLRAASSVLEESRVRVEVLRSRLGGELSVSERESCEALTSRFARLNDLLVQRVFRTLDGIELSDDGSVLDRLLRMEKRGIIPSAERWRELRQLRNEIAHDYLITSADRVLVEALGAAPELRDAARLLEQYASDKGYVAVK